MHAVLDRLVPEVIGRPVRLPPADSRPRQPDREAPVVVVPPQRRLPVRQLHRRCPPELTAAQHHRLVKQPPLLQIGQQRRDGLVGLPPQPAVVFVDLVVAVPRLHVAMKHLHEPHPPLNQPAGNQQLAAMQGIAIQLAHRLRLLGDVERIARRILHPIRQLEALDPRLERRVFAPHRLVPPVHLRQQIKLPTLLSAGGPRAPHMVQQFAHLALAGVDVRSLVNSRQERRPPVRDIGDGKPRAHRHIARQVLVLGPHSVGDPRPQAGPAQPLIPAVHQPHRLLMVRRVGVHRADHAQVVGMCRRLREDLADLQPRFP